ncbi:MAG: CPBP family intramembrane metalloprotease [Ignavibacteria bacterium]|nr:CPBP family intramembrane metalloprotease [Ignavibacteria bacterium]
MEGQDDNDGARAEPTFWVADGELRAIWKLSAFFAVWVIVFFAGAIVAGFLPLPMYSPHLQSSIFLAAALAATLFGMLAVDRAPFASVGFGDRHAVRHFAIGVGVSSGMMGGVFLIELASGAAIVRLSSVTVWQAAQLLASGFTLYLIVGFAEEILLRGYPFRTLLRATNPAATLLVTSVLFSLIHFWNPSISLPALCNICLAGVWLGRARLVTGQLWLPIGLHTGWNFTQGTVLGYPVSGMVEGGVFRTDAIGAEWYTGGYFGPEGGALATVVLVLGTLALWHPRVIARLRVEARADIPATDAIPVVATGDAPAASAPDGGED